MNKNEIFKTKTKLLDDGLLMFADSNHQVKITFSKTKESKILEKTETKLFVEDFNKLDDIELLLGDNKVKENIIIKKQRESYKYLYNLEVTNLVLVEENKQYFFLDKETKGQVFKLSEFIMFDSDFKESKNIKVKVKQTDEEHYELEVTPSKRWINSRVRKFPVIVDPSIETVSTEFIEFESTVNNTLIQTQSKARVGIKNNVSQKLNIKINFGWISNELYRKNIADSKCDIFLELHYDSTKSKTDATYRTSNSSMILNYKVDETNKFRVNISKLFGIPSSTYVTIPFEHINSENALTLDDDYIDIYTSEVYGEELRPKIVFDYKDVNSMPEHTKEFRTNKAGTTYLDLHNGNFTHKVNVGSIKHNALNMGLNLVLSSNLLYEQSLDTKDKHLSKGWKTNFHQYIVTSNEYNDILASDSVSYIDGDGFAHELRDSWYYEVDGVKKYINKCDIYYDENNELKAKVDGVIYDVKGEFTNSEGLTYIPTQGKFNFKRIESPTKQKRYYISGGNFNIYIYIDDYNNIHIPLFKDVNNTYYKMIDVMLDEKGVYVDKNNKNLLVEKIAIIKLNRISENEGGTLNIKINRTSFEDSIYYDALLETLEDLFIDYLEMNLHIEETCIVNNDYEIEKYFINEDIENINNQIENIKEYIKNANTAVNEYKNAILNVDSNSYYQKELSVLNDLSEHLNSAQKTQYVNKYMDEVDKLNSYKDLLRKYQFRKEQLVKEQNNGVNDVLIDSNKNMLGFDGKGRLILIQDGYGNTINVVYGTGNDTTKILSIESPIEKITFEYDKNNLLSKIIDQYGRVIKVNNGQINGYNDSLSVEVNDEEFMFINSPSIYYIVEDYGMVRELHKTNSQVTKVEEYYTGDVDEFSDPFSGVKEKGVIHTYTYNSNVTTETITKIHNSFYNKVNTYEFDGAGRIIKSVNHKKDYVINEYEGKHLVGEYSFNKDKDLYVDLKDEGLSKEVRFEANDNTTGMYAYVIEQNDQTSTMKNMKFNLLIYKVEEDGSNTYLYGVYKTVYDYGKTIFIPFKVPKGCKVFLKPYNSHTFASSDITSMYITRINGNQHTYDKDGHLIRSENGLAETVYEDFQGDNPKKVTVTDLEHGEVMVNRYGYDSINRLTYVEDYFGNVIEHIYNDCGQLVEKKKYHKDEPTLCTKERYQYDDKGNVVTLDGVMKDKSGNTPSTKIEYTRGLISKVKTPSGKITNYGHDFNTDELLSLSSEVDGVSNVNRFKYKRSLLESLEHDGFKVNYEYDCLGRRVSTFVNDELYVSTEYDDNYMVSGEVYYGTKVTNTYNNEHTVSAVFDMDGYLVKEYKDSLSKSYTYDKYDNITKIVTSDGYINKQYTYDSYNNVISEVNGSNCSKTFAYGDKQRLSHETQTYNSKTFDYDYTYDEENKVILDKVSLTLDDALLEKEFEYDVLNRINTQTFNVNGEEFIKDEYEYLTVEDNALSLIREHNILFKDSLLETNSYEYDLNGNIIKVVTNEDETRYHYDSLNRLIREDNPLLNKTITYKYDKRGNILLRKEYEYSLETDLLTEIKVDKFTYGNEGWKDQLTKYNDETFIYDSMGRPTTYRGMTTVWNKDGTLANMGGKYSYIKRNYDGMFFERRLGPSTYSMITTKVDGNKILYDNGMTFIYILDKLVGLIDNGSRYYYQRNIQGDITHIYNEDSTLVAKYVYDAYGRHKVLTSSLEEDTNLYSIGNTNPFRYRGYYFDKVLGLYFLTSRYYDPETCRFISPDVISILDETKLQINGLNLYAYCNNNPVMYVDPIGRAWYNVLWDWANTIAGFLNPVSKLTAIGSIAYAVIDGRWDAVVRDWKKGCFDPFNQSASTALNSEVFSFYKGESVVRHSVPNSSSLQIFGTIFLNSNEKDDPAGYGIESLNHEWGHGVQERFLGFGGYMPLVFIPSVINYWFGEHNYRKVLYLHYNPYYYTKIFERTADYLGGVSRIYAYPFWDSRNFIPW